MHVNNQLIQTHELKIVHWNCFKMTQTRLFEFELFLREIQPDIVSIQEVKMNREQANLFLGFDGFITYYKPRENKAEFCCGNAIVVKNSISHTIIPNMDQVLDHLGIRVETNDFCFNLFSLYSPSNTLKFETFLKYKELGSEIFILGDLNSKTPIVGCRSLDTNGKILEEISSSELNLCILNDESPTYFKFNNEYTEILDLMLCSPKLANKMTHFDLD